jgi:WD40 repeat protein
MTDQRELDRLLGTFFVEGPDELADRVIDAALDQVGRTRQRRALRLPGRFQTMPMFARAAAAAVIGVLAVGTALYLTKPAQPVVGGPSPAPAATSSPSQTASPSAGASSSLVQPRPASWTATGSMGTARMKQVATLLPDGKVLVAGGTDKACYCADIVSYASAELYDPTSGSWTTTGSMLTHSGGGFTLTLLHDGRVLAAGGGTSELYDPRSGTWTATGKMVISHPSDNATLLRDGRVLVSGGGDRNGNTALASAELYDPVSGTWTATGSMTAPRWAGTARLLLDGKVLVFGGIGSKSPPDLNSAELYDPGTGTWTATGSMVTTRGSDTTTLLRDGRVLVAGFTGDIPGSAELYDPASGTWTATGKMVAGANADTATLLLNGKVLVAGVSDQLYDPGSGSWTATASMGAVRGGPTATLLADGRTLVAGGALPADAGSAQEATASAELYDPGTAGPSSSVVQPKPGMFAYIVSSYHTGQLWVANVDGTRAHQLFPDLGGSQGAPAWSPDGTRLVFSHIAQIDPVGLPTGQSRLYLTDASGSAPQLVGTGCVAPCTGDSDAAFSSDGTRLVFVRTTALPPRRVLEPALGNDVLRSPSASVLATIDLSTGRVTELASTTVSEVSGGFPGTCPACPGPRDFHPRWSPDGTQIVFTQDVPVTIPPLADGTPAVDPIPAVFVVDADGSNLRRIGLPARSADWSPDGSKIVFGSVSYVVPKGGSLMSPGARQYYDIYTIRPDGTGLRRLTTDRFSSQPSWSAGGRIGFWRAPTVNGDVGTLQAAQLWIMDADGSNDTQLSFPPLQKGAWQISWPPQP